MSDSELPEGWAWSTLAELAEIKGGITKGKARDPDVVLESVPYLRVANVQRARLDLSEMRTIEATPKEVATYSLQKGDVLFNEGGDRDKLGRGWVWQEEVPRCIHQNHVFRARPRGAIEPEYLSWWGNSDQAQRYFLAAGKQSTNLASINLSQLSALPVPVPPLNEQRRIVAKMDQLRGHSRRAREALDEVPALLDQLKQSVLAAAFRGDLTADWRAAHPDVEPASTLLDRIRAERRQRWEQANPGKRYVLPESTDEDTERLPRLPSGWVWASVDEVGDVLLGRQRAPQYLTGHHSRPYLRVANIKDDRISYEDVEQMDFDPGHLARYRLQRGDILVSEGQSLHLVGQSAIYAGTIPDLCFQKTLHRFRAVTPGPSPEFAQLVFRAWVRMGVFQRRASITTNIAHLTLERFKRTPFPLAPLEEQAELVRLAAGALAATDQLASTVDRVRDELGILEAGTLAKAFRGELVPQDPNDEPAEALLARIRAASAASPPPARRGRKPLETA